MLENMSLTALCNAILVEGASLNAAQQHEISSLYNIGYPLAGLVYDGYCRPREGARGVLEETLYAIRKLANSLKEQVS